MCLLNYLYGFFIWFFYVVYATQKDFQKRITTFRDCVKPWQKPVMTIPTISRPSHPVLCHPDYNPCQKDRSECQFSFTSFQYVCCEDRNDVKPPECPKFYNTLRTLCGGVHDASCPRGYECLASRFDASIEVCCKPNNSLVYPEPDTSFKDNYIVPEHLPTSPLTSVNLTFNGLTLEVGQLISGLDIENYLEDPPTITSFNGDDHKLYTILLFGYPRNAPAFLDLPNPAKLYWLIHDVSVVSVLNGTLYSTFDERPKSGKRRDFRTKVLYTKPDIQIKPPGIHTMALVVFEQHHEWEEPGKNQDRRRPGPKRKHSDQARFVVKDWLSEVEENIIKTPVAGNFYGFMSESEWEITSDSKSNELDDQIESNRVVSLKKKNKLK